MKNESNTIPYITVLRVIAMFAVIVIHTLNMSSVTPGDDMWHVVLVLQGFCCSWAVPIFVMISGALFLDPEHQFSLIRFLSKNVFRILLSIACFGFLFAVMESVFRYHAFNISIVAEAAMNNLTANNWAHLWYLYMILGLYLLIPMFRVFTEHAEKKIVLFTIAVLVLYNCVLNTITIVSDGKINIGSKFPIRNIWVMYLLLGYAYHKNFFSISGIVSAIMVGVGVAYIITCSSIQSLHYLVVDVALRDSLPGLILSIGIFGVFKNCKKLRVTKATATVSELSYGIYIFHGLVLNLLYKVVRIESFMSNIVIIWVVVFCITFALSALLTYILRRSYFVRTRLL